MKLSLVMPYYDNPRMLFRQYLIWRDEWAEEWKDETEVVIVDDGSPNHPAATVERPAGLPILRIFRVKADIPWHQHGARNLGAHVARASWLLMTDMDHVIPPDTMRFCLTLANGPSRSDIVRTFGRRDAPASEPWRADHVSTMAKTVRPDGSLKPHVNSFLLTKETYWRAGGYDEDYCGTYGTDSEFRRRLYATAIENHFPHMPIIRVSREVIPDASTVGLARKEGRAPGAKRAIRERKAAAGRADVISTLQFEWERVV